MLTSKRSVNEYNSERNQSSFHSLTVNYGLNLEKLWIQFTYKDEPYLIISSICREI
ncbi:hypothetical protein RO3G_15765 [Rhizopus delemar RA 99-880]|uniref:Uncharacterized protein n=1 Tax=Rhizopus delemar (strain RA 99-880 / ATCC MYA-4621 / FGSC 9543 / NRRL 43880) TaxID=246409 RepID=I1CRH4_RHIO9|nr:hypothetical protein RO3G_15765 [Rhizopus delemar RA 99-880]|eukprot:EIE91054.1 hypothetical protein RO3G_15765 [Rhizopus delemar RA 99-880]